MRISSASSTDSTRFPNGNRTASERAVRILITGGAGYIGTVLIRRLVESGHQVRCLDPRASDLTALLPQIWDRRPMCDLRVADIRDRRSLAIALDKIDAVIHLAAVVGYPACDADPQGARSINVAGTRALAQTLSGGVPVLYLSTCSVYGKSANGICRESDPVRPLTLYGRTKLSGERIVLQHGAVVLRAPTAYGISPRFRRDLIIHDFIHRGLTGQRLRLFQPHAIRPFIHVEDIARAIQCSLDLFPAMAGNIYNIGSDDGTVTKLELAQRIAAVTGLVIEVDESREDPDGRDYRIDYANVHALGFRTARCFDTGLRETVDWIRSRSLQKPALP